MVTNYFEERSTEIGNDITMFAKVANGVVIKLWLLTQGEGSQEAMMLKMLVESLVK
jgi:hypothetical protein